jgi:hypothetical protein
MTQTTAEPERSHLDLEEERLDKEIKQLQQELMQLKVDKRNLEIVQIIKRERDLIDNQYLENQGPINQP